MRETSILGDLLRRQATQVPNEPLLGVDSSHVTDSERLEAAVLVRALIISYP